MRKMKSFLLIGLAAGCLLSSSRAHANWEGCLGFMCFKPDYLHPGVKLILRDWMNAHTDIQYDVKNGLETIKHNIGQYRSEDGNGGDCGISATGNSGCHTSTAEKGAKDAQKMQEEAAVVADSTIKIIGASETDGEITFDQTSIDELKELGAPFSPTGSTFDKVRVNVSRYMFETDSEKMNEDCTCSAGTGKACSTTECALTRQNDALVVSTTGAASLATRYLQKKTMENYYNEIKKAIEQLKEDTEQQVATLTNPEGNLSPKATYTVDGATGGLGNLVVVAADILAETMILQTHDLRAQSYRNLVFSGIKLEDLKTLTEDTDEN